MAIKAELTALLSLLSRSAFNINFVSADSRVLFSLFTLFSITFTGEVGVVFNLLWQIYSIKEKHEIDVE